MKILPFLVLCSLGAVMHHAVAADETFYVGTYTKAGGSRGIYRFTLNSDTGEVTEGGIAVETLNPTFLAIAPGGKTLYAINEVAQGGVGAFAVQPDGKLKLLNLQSTKGAGPAHVSLDSAGKHVLVANYSGGSVAVLPVKPDGSLGAATGFAQHTGSSVNPQRQKEPHAHSFYTTPTDAFAVACDLGIDKLMVYRFDAATGAIKPNEVPSVAVKPGSGPRHLAFHPEGYAYVINELSNTITSFTLNAKRGAMAEIETVSTLPADFNGPNTTAEIAIHPNNRFLYGSNRGHNSIVAYTIDANNGKLTLVGHTPTDGKTPRNFAIDPTGRFLLAANQDSDNIVVFEIDSDTGALKPTGKSVKCGAPVCVAFVPSAP